PRDTLRLFVPTNARDGRAVSVEISSAATTSGRTIETGYIDEYKKFAMNIEGFVDIPVGTYTGTRTSADVGNGAASVAIAKPATPVTINGVSYAFTISDYTGDGLVFGEPGDLFPIPWAFNVTSGGTVLAAPRSHVVTVVTSTVVGTYNFT